MFDVIVIGGGPAGLSAALMLGRCRRRVLVCDAGSPRNRRSRSLHGYLTRDGIPPSEFTRIARTELACYGIELRDVGVTSVRPAEREFTVCLEGGATETSRYLLLATGVIDELPGIPGFDDCYGTSVFHCPYCDGWEWRDRPLAAFGSRSHAVGLGLGLRTWSHDVVVCSNGSRLDRRTTERLARNGVQVQPGRVEALEHEGGVLSAIRFDNGERLPRAALFFTTGQHPQSGLAIGLGCDITSHGTIKTTTICGTNVPRVFVAGDASRDAQFVVVAAAEGVKAAVAINRALQAEELNG